MIGHDSEISDFLRKPYVRAVVPEPDGTFRAEILEFPGCITTGETAAEALTNLESVAAAWLEATLVRGQAIPQPINQEVFSGKLVLRLPKSLHRRASATAAREGISLNQFIVSCVAECVGRHEPARIVQSGQITVNVWHREPANAVQQTVSPAQSLALSGPQWIQTSSNKETIYAGN